MFIRPPLPRALSGASRHHHHRLSSALSIGNRLACRRAYAAAATKKASSPATSYSVTNVDGLRVVSRDDGGATTALTLVLRAGSRYAPLPGLAHLLDKFAWKGTSKRTAFRVTRETELLGGLLSSSSSRENVTVSAQCLREDIPYFLEALADVALFTNYTDYEFHDDVLPLAQLEYDHFQTDPISLALDSLHNSAFHRGLGYSILATPTYPIHAHQVQEYALSAYSKANAVLVASGASVDELKPQLEEFWKGIPDGEPLKSSPTKYFGGEARIPHRSETNVYGIAFPGSAAYGPNVAPEYVVLSHFLGGISPVKWSVGHSAFAKLSSGISQTSLQLVCTNIAYSDAGLFAMLALGSPDKVKDAATSAVKLLRDIAKGSHVVKPEELKRAIASAKFVAFADTESRLTGLESIGQSVLDTEKVVDVAAVAAGLEKVTADKIKQAANKLLETSPSVVAVGQTQSLPFYDEL